MDYGAQGVRCQLGYIRTIPGILNLIELLCDLLAVILCGAASSVEGGSGHKGFFLFVSILALIITFILFVLALLNIHSVVLVNRWPMIEFIWCAFIALFYFIASIVIATIANKNGTYGAAAFFGFAAFITYVADAVFKFRANRSSAYADNSPQYPPNAASQQYGGPNPSGQRPQPTY